ncbi:hypothetical protein Tco_0898005 [Tanacetum coccineum]
MFDEVQAGIDADALFAAKLQQEEREKYTIEERAKFLAETIAAQRKFRAAQRAAEIRSIPPTKSQLRNLMMTYVAVKDSKKAAGEDTSKKKEVLKEPDSTKIKSMNKEDTGERVSDVSKKRKGGTRIKRMSKRMKTKSDLEEEEDLKTFLKIVPDKEGIIDYEVYRRNGSSRWIKTFSKTVTRFDRPDLVDLYNLVMQMFETITPEGNCGVHSLTLEDGTMIHMLAKRKYPLTKETLERMMFLKLIAKSESDSAYDLLRFIQKKIDEAGSYDGGEKDL